MKIGDKLITEFNKNRPNLSKIMVLEYVWSLIFTFKEGSSNKFKSIIDDILIDAQQSERLLNTYTNFYKSFKDEEILREFIETFSNLISK